MSEANQPNQIHLFLDDVRELKDQPCFKRWPNANWKVVRNYTDFILACREELPVFVSFDHDLSYEHVCETMTLDDYKWYLHGTGVHCAWWLKQWCKRINYPFPKWSVHSSNPCASKNIHAVLDFDYGPLYGLLYVKMQ